MRFKHLSGPSKILFFAFAETRWNFYASVKHKSVFLNQKIVYLVPCGAPDCNASISLSLLLNMIKNRQIECKVSSRLLCFLFLNYKLIWCTKTIVVNLKNCWFWPIPARFSILTHHCCSSYITLFRLSVKAIAYHTNLWIDRFDSIFLEGKVCFDFWENLTLLFFFLTYKVDPLSSAFSIAVRSFVLLTGGCNCSAMISSNVCFLVFWPDILYSNSSQSKCSSSCRLQ